MKPTVAPRHPAFGLVVIALTAIAISFYVLERPRQSEFESRGIGRIASWLRLHEALYPGVRITNVSQLFGEVSNGYPHFLHEQFRMFGKHAGFENSIAEKYVFLDPPIPLASSEIDSFHQRHALPDP
jgi:hypothetical protein